MGLPRTSTTGFLLPGLVSTPSEPVPGFGQEEADPIVEVPADPCPLLVTVDGRYWGTRCRGLRALHR